jgi:hypothetical protein
MENYKKVIVFILIFLIPSLIVFAYFYGPSLGIFPERVEREKLVVGLSKFYKNDYYKILENQSTYFCNIFMKILTLEKMILIDTQCTVTPPYSAIEAFLAVGRGNISTNGMKFYTGLSWDMDEKEAFKHRLQLIAYPIVAVRINETVVGNTTYLCFLPCLDNSQPTSFDILSVKYNPSKEQLSKLFQDYSQEKFKELIVYSEYKYVLHYDHADDMLEWRYLLGQFESGKFKLEIEADKQIVDIKNERDEVQTLIEIPKGEYEIIKLGENLYTIRGFATGVDRLVVKW